MNPRAPFLAGLLLACLPPLFSAVEWRPITADELAVQLPASEATANGLTILREIWVDCSDLERTKIKRYIRTKVFNTAGVDALNKTEIMFERDTPILDLAARVVKPDGRIVPVAPSDIFTREVLKSGGVTVLVKAFSFAGIEPGDIAEYQYRTVSSELSLGFRIYLDDDFPTALTRIRISKVKYPGLKLQVLSPEVLAFKLTNPSDPRDLVYEACDLPSTIVESFPPPEDEAKPWFTYYYTFREGSDNEYWNKTGTELMEFARTYCAPKSRLKEKAAALVAGAGNEEEAVGRLYEFCRTGIKNLSYDDSDYTTEQIASLKENRTAADVLGNGYGYADEINLLFAALMRATGHDCTPAYCSDRSESTFNKVLTFQGTLPHLIVAQEGRSWTYYDPGARFLPPGKLRWQNEHATVLIPAGKTCQLVETPQSPVSYTTTKRSGTLSIAEDGTLEGDLSWSLAGHVGYAALHRFTTKTPKERMASVEEEIRQRLPNAEITDCSVTLPADLSSPPTITCHVRVPDYATSVGERLLLPLAFFQKGATRPFAATNRRTNVCFPYFESEHDLITLTLPEGYELEPQRPFEDPEGGDLLHYSAQISLTAGGRGIVFERWFARKLFGSPADNYEELRAVYETVAAQDARLFSFRATAAAADTQAP